MTKSTITILASRANDILQNYDGGVIETRPGGPGLYIEAALDDAEVPYLGEYSDPIDVEIRLGPIDESSKVANTPPRRRLSSVNASDWCVVSTVLDEWTIDKVPENLYLDIQGYVRDGSDFGKKKLWNVDSSIAAKIRCLKGTEEEMRYLPPSVFAEQKARLLVVTHGSKGVTIFHKGSRISISADEVADLPDTIGAGDTFFGYFVAEIYRGNNPTSAGEYAIKKTRAFLLSKLSA